MATANDVCMYIYNKLHEYFCKDFYSLEDLLSAVVKVMKSFRFICLSYKNIIPFMHHDDDDASGSTWRARLRSSEGDGDICFHGNF
jgi:hypothetical protein